MGRSAETGAALNFNLGQDCPCDGIAIHVYGNGDPIPRILHLLAETGWFAIDTGQGEWVHHSDDLARGYAQFRAYRESVLRRLCHGNPT